jgi:hypothetical protein
MDSHIEDGNISDDGGGSGLTARISRRRLAPDHAAGE